MPNKLGQRVSESRSVQMLFLAIVGAIAIIGLVVVMTPLTDDPDLLAPGASTVQAASPPNADLTGLDASTSDAANLDGARQASQPASAMRRISIEELGLPTEAEPVDVAKLQLELTELAERLCSEQGANPAALHLAAQIYFELKKTAEAEATWRACVEQKPTQAGPYLGLADLWIAAGKEQSAVDLLSKPHAQNISSPAIVATLATALENLGELERCEEVLSSGISQHPVAPELWRAIGRVRNQLGKHEQAEKNLTYALQLGGLHEPTLLTLATALSRQKKSEQAQQIREQLEAIQSRESTPEDTFQERYDQTLTTIASRMFLASASLMEQTDALEESERLVRRSISLIPEQLTNYMSLSSVFRKQGRFGAALAVHELLVKKQPENLINHINLASLATSLGEFAMAEATLKKAEQLAPGDAVIQASLAKFYLSVGNPPQAQYYSAQVVAQTQTAESYMLLAAAYESGGNVEAAQTALNRAAELDPNHPMLLQIRSNELQP